MYTKYVSSVGAKELLDHERRIQPCSEMEYDDQKDGCVIVDQTMKRSHYSLMCEKCYHLFPVTLSATYVLQTDTLYQTHEYCCKCQWITPHAVVDQNIAESIRLLNKKGFRTIFSCEGHGTTDGYIMFESRPISEYLHTLPLTWFVWKHDYSYYTYGLDGKDTPKKVTIIRSNPCDYYQAMFDLQEWVEQLPNCIPYQLKYGNRTIHGWKRNSFIDIWEDIAMRSFTREEGAE